MAHRSLRTSSLAVLIVLLTYLPTSQAGATPTTPGATTRTVASATSDAVTWAIEPSGAGETDDRISIRLDVDPGSTVTDEVTVTNFSDRASSFRIYASDGTTTAAGDFDLLPPQEEPVDGGSWITVGPVDGARSHASGGLVVDVPADATVAIPVHIDVPQDATPGDHPAGVVAELVHEGSSPVQVASRVGVRVHLRVSGDLVASLVPQDVDAVWVPTWNPFSPGTVRVSYVVANEGNVRLGAAVRASISGPFGAAENSTGQEHREILPGQEQAVTAELVTWPLVVAHGEVTVAPAAVGEDVVDAEMVPATIRFTAWTIPWSQLALLLLLVGGWLGARHRRKRRGAAVQQRIDAAVAAAVSDHPPVDPSAEPQ